MYSRTPISRPSLQLSFFGIVAIFLTFLRSSLRFQFLLQRIAEKKAKKEEEETGKAKCGKQIQWRVGEMERSRSWGCGWARRHRRWSHSFLTSCPNIDSTVCVTALLSGCMGVWVCVSLVFFLCCALSISNNILPPSYLWRCVVIAVCCRFLLCVILARNRQLFKLKISQRITQINKSTLLSLTYL